MFKGVAPHLWVADMERSMEFYSSMLGFETTMTYPDDGPLKWCMMERGETAVMLATYPESDTPFAGLVRKREGEAGSMILYMAVDDVDADHARAVARGAKIVDPISDKFYGVREFVVEDPDGHWWSLEKDLG